MSSDSEVSEDLIDKYIIQKAHRRSTAAPTSPTSPTSSTSPSSPSQSQLGPEGGDVEQDAAERPDNPVPSTSLPSIRRSPTRQLIGVTIAADDDAQNSNQLVQSLLRRTRYFDEEYEEASIRCNNCGQKGHMARDCRNERRQKPCFLCAQPGHESWSCPNRYCFKCGKTGHLSRECSSANTRDLQRVCLRCGREDCSGAGMGDAFRSEGGCSKDYLASDMQRVRCYVCYELGHLCCQPAPTEAAQMSCYNCGGNDHWGEQCGLEGTVQLQQERRADSRRPPPSLARWGGGREYANASATPWDASDRHRDLRRNTRQEEDRWDMLGGGGRAGDEALFTIGSYQAAKAAGNRHHRRGRGR